MPYGSWEACHQENVALANAVRERAVSKGLSVARNQSSARSGRFDGYHRYLIYRAPCNGAVTIRSRCLVRYSQARYSRYFTPSASGEREALIELSRWLDLLEDSGDALA